MSTPETTNGQATDLAACTHCGETLPATGRFCPRCGQAVIAPVAGLPAGAGDRPTEEMQTPPADAAGSGVGGNVPGPARPSVSAPSASATVPASRAVSERPRRRLLVAAIAAVVVGVLGLLVLVLVSGGSSSKPDPAIAYRQKVAGAFGPVLGANRQAADALSALHGRNPSAARAADARVAVRRAQQAVTLATGAVGAMSVPAAADQLARDARQALVAESNYYAEVAGVLERPATTSTTAIAPLASNLTSALTVAGPSVAGTQPTVSGSDRLISWARAIRVRHDARVRRPRSSGGASRPSSPAPASAPAPVQPTLAPSANTRSCGGGVFANSVTSCPFALLVRQAWGEAPGTTNTLRVFSPVTGQVYTMSCAPSGSAITCSGGNNASVTFGG
jgi:hypothetical protein